MFPPLFGSRFGIFWHAALPAHQGCCFIVDDDADDDDDDDGTTVPTMAMVLCGRF
jgi:hypothetical protein